MLDVRRMKVLREVAAQGSFSAAAEALNFTQSAVEPARRRARARDRHAARGARSRAACDSPRRARVLVAHADAILARLDSAEEDLAAIAGLRGGRLQAGLLPERRGHGRCRAPWPPSTSATRTWSWRCARPSRDEAAAHAEVRRRRPGARLRPPGDDDDARPRADRTCWTTATTRCCPPATRSPERRRLSLADLADEPWIVSTRT